MLRRIRGARAAADDAQVLEALGCGGEHSTYQIGRLARLWPGRLAPALFRLEHAGILKSRFADEPAPRRRLYRKVP